MFSHRRSEIVLDRFTGMRVFQRVAATGSLSAAARSLGMSQTMATKHVAALEARLGVELVHRSTRRLTLTEAGRRYLESVDRILAAVEEAESGAEAQQASVSGTLRVAAPVSFGVRWIAPLVAEFVNAHPGVAVDLDLSDRYVDLIEDGFDLAVRIGRMQDSAMIARRIAPCRLRVAAAPDYLRRRGRPQTVNDLSRHACLTYTLGRMQAPGRWLFGPDGRIGVAVSGPVRANNGDALLAAAIAGEGLVYEPTFILHDALRTGALVAVDLDEPPTDLPGIYAVQPGHRLAAAKVRAFIDLLARRFGPVPPWDRGLPEPGPA
jgi:molybdate transport repressor ModE-like protein